jgi:ribose transport system ATP-binding protein
MCSGLENSQERYHCVESAIELDGLSKEFPGVVALDGVSFTIGRGQVHGLVGENGAGKSTLVNILAGAFPDYRGRILAKNVESRITSFSVSEKLGIYTVFQEPNVLLNLDVPTNVYLGKEPLHQGTGFVVDKKRRYQLTESVFRDRLKVEIDLKKRLRDLTISERQVIGIAKGLVRNADVFILDEPTASLTRAEIMSLFGIVNELRQSGKTVVFISHRLDEVFEITDRLTVLRDGHHIVTGATRDFTMDELITAMVGKKIESRYPRTEGFGEEVLLEVQHLSRADEFSDISFQLHKGEILGLAGVMGAGRTELAKAIFGATRRSAGKIFVRGRELTAHSPRSAIRLGMGFLTEDKRNESLILILDVLRNIVISKLEKIIRHLYVSFGLGRKMAARYVEMLAIKTPSLSQRVEYLSGGNQQKVVFSKLLFAGSQILLIDEPTKGVDVGAKFEIYKIIHQLAADGAGVLLISSELQELAGLCHTILVMHEGRMVRMMANRNLDEKKILSLALGEESV